MLVQTKLQSPPHPPLALRRFPHLDYPWVLDVWYQDLVRHYDRIAGELLYKLHSCSLVGSTLFDWHLGCFRHLHHTGRQAWISAPGHDSLMYLELTWCSSQEILSRIPVFSRMRAAWGWPTLEFDDTNSSDTVRSSSNTMSAKVLL